MSAEEQEVLEAVDQIADGIEDEVERAAERLGLGVEEIMDRVKREVVTRLAE